MKTLEKNIKRLEQNVLQAAFPKEVKKTKKRRKPRVLRISLRWARFFLALFRKVKH